MFTHINDEGGDMLIFAKALQNKIKEIAYVSTRLKLVKLNSFITY